MLCACHFLCHCVSLTSQSNCCIRVANTVKPSHWKCKQRSKWPSTKALQCFTFFCPWNARVKFQVELRWQDKHTTIWMRLNNNGSMLIFCAVCLGAYHKSTCDTVTSRINRLCRIVWIKCFSRFTIDARSQWILIQI